MSSAQRASTTQVSFISKVSKVKTRTRANKNYYIYRMNIPNDKSDKLQLSKVEYLLVQARKAEWYHMENWKEMQTTWRMLPSALREEIKGSGLEVPDEPQIQAQFEPIASPTGPVPKIMLTTPSGSTGSKVQM